MQSPPHEQPASPTALEQHLSVASDRCPMCGYNLHKLQGGNCPECGYELVLRVAVSNPRMGAFYTGLIGLSAGAGFAALVMLWGIIMGAYSDVIVLLVEVLVLGALAMVWIRFSGRIRRLPAHFRWPLAICTWLLSIAALFIFVWAIGDL